MAKITKELKNLIENNVAAFSTCSNNQPNVIAVACLKCMKNSIIITDNYMSKTLKNIRNNKRAALVVWNKAGKGFQLKGSISYHTKGRWHDLVKGMKENKGLPARGAILFKPAKVFKLA